MFSAEQCQTIIDEASPHVDPIRVRVTTCRAWKVPRNSATAKLVNAFGLPSSQAQVVRYGVGGSYDWHDDGSNRKSTVVILLSDPSSYDGGMLEFESRSGPIEAHTRRGLPLRFDASLRHRVSEVTRGERFALVVWE